MATHNRIQDINSKYQRVESQNLFNPPIQFRKSEVRSTVTQNVMHPTITNQKPRYLNSLIASPIGSHFTSQNKFKQEAVTHGITRSRVTVTHTPGVLETNTITPRVYQIVQPIIQITPAVVNERREQRVSHNRPLQIARGVQGTVQIPSPPPLSSRRKSCCQTYCGCCSSCCTGSSCRQCLGCKCCPWWLSIILCLLLFILPLVLGLIYLCTNPRFNHSKLQESLISFNKTEITGQQNQTTAPIKQQNETQQQSNKQTIDEQYVKQLNRILKEANQTQNNQSNQKNTNESDHPLTSDPPPAFNNTNSINKQKVTITNISCPFGYFFFGKKCLSCPDQSAWNGTNCIKRILIQPKGSIIKTNLNKSTETVVQPNISQQNPDIYVANAWSVVQPKTHIKNAHLKRNYL